MGAEDTSEMLETAREHAAELERKLAQRDKLIEHMSGELEMYQNEQSFPGDAVRERNAALAAMARVRALTEYAVVVARSAENGGGQALMVEVTDLEEALDAAPSDALAEHDAELIETLSAELMAKIGWMHGGGPIVYVNGYDDPSIRTDLDKWFEQRAAAIRAVVEPMSVDTDPEPVTRHHAVMCGNSSYEGNAGVCFVPWCTCPCHSEPRAAAEQKGGRHLTSDERYAADADRGWRP